MIRSFRDQATADLFAGVRTRASRSALAAWSVARRKLAQLDAVTRLEELRAPPGNHLEALARGRNGQHSIRVNDQYRLCVTWSPDGPEDVEFTDYH